MSDRPSNFVMVACLLGLIGALIWSYHHSHCGSDARAAAIQWAKSAPAYTLIDTHMFNGNEWKTYRQNKTGKLFLLTPGGEFIEVED